MVILKKNSHNAWCKENKMSYFKFWWNDSTCITHDLSKYEKKNSTIWDHYSPLHENNIDLCFVVSEKATWGKNKTRVGT